MKEHKQSAKIINQLEIYLEVRFKRKNLKIICLEEKIKIKHRKRMLICLEEAMLEIYSGGRDHLKHQK